MQKGKGVLARIHDPITPIASIPQTTPMRSTTGEAPSGNSQQRQGNHSAKQLIQQPWANSGDSIAENKAISSITQKSHQKDSSQSCRFLANPYPNQTISGIGLKEEFFWAHFGKPTKQKSKGKDLKV
jgi:hypothetical protein